MGQPESFKDRARATDAVGGPTITASGILMSESPMHSSDVSLPRVSTIAGQERRGQPQRTAGDSELVVAEGKEVGVPVK